KHAAGRGTTTIITETMGVGCSMGYQGMLWFMEAIKDQPIRIFAVASTMIPGNPKLQTATVIKPEEWEQLLVNPQVVGLGEAYWTTVLDNEELYENFALALGHRKTIEGHSAGARGRMLMAYLATGVSSCHEPINADEVLERLRLGVCVMIREGSIRRELETVAPVLSKANIDFRRLSLCSDGLDGEEMIRYGYMEYIVQKAINLGFDPITAVQMATLNVAEHFGLAQDLGGIAPGKMADFLLIPDLRIIQARWVICKGQMIAREGQLIIPPRVHHYPPEAYRSIRLRPEFTADDFAIPAPGREQARVRIIQQVTDMLTKEGEAILPVVNGVIQQDPSQDILKVATMSFIREGQKTVALIKGFGIRQGAFASSTAWDEPNISVLGDNEDDMAQAVNHVINMGGGTVVCQSGKITAELATPIGAQISEETVEGFAEKTALVTRAIKDLGYPGANPMLGLDVLTFVGVPKLRMSSKGLVSSKERKLVDLIIDGGD
ncbi:MAG: adenine deaminase C-terminal domain-containing protein, partial [Bacillota bacterium]